MTPSKTLGAQWKSLGDPVENSATQGSKLGHFALNRFVCNKAAKKERGGIAEVSRAQCCARDRKLKRPADAEGTADAKEPKAETFAALMHADKNSVFLFV